MTHFLLAVLFAAAVQAETPVKGRLCVAEKKAILTEGTCREVTGVSFEVAPVDRDRLFLWTSADWKTAQFGTVAAKSSAVALTSDDRHEVKVAIRGEASRGWPAETHVSFRTRDEWQWLVPARRISRLERIALPSGQYFIEIRADRHRPLHRRVDAREPITDAGEYRLDPLLQIRGRVVNAEDQPLSATVTLADGAFCAATDEQGAFTCELPPRMRAIVAISAAGYGTREIFVDRTVDADMNAGTIRMSKGRTLTVKLTRDLLDQRPIKLTLFSDRQNRYDRTRIKTIEVPAGEKSVGFEDLLPGRYVIVAAGGDPLERLTVATEMSEGEEGSVDVIIEPFRLEGSAHYGEDPITQGTVEVIDRDRGWRERVPLNPDGTFGGTMWQKGIVSGVVGPQPERTERIASPTLGADPSVWRIRIVKREIAGRITDAVTGNPIDEAALDVAVRWQSDGGSGRTMRSVSIRPDGSYIVLATRPGDYKLTVKAPEYMTKVVELRISAEDGSRKVDVPLERGVGQPLEFVSVAGVPLSRVVILEGVRDDYVNPATTHVSDRGRFTLRGRAGETRLLYLVPSDGSFATARITLPRHADDVKPMQIVIPPVAGSLRIRTIDPDDRPVAARILLRYGGELVPPAILRFITGDDTMTSNSSGEGVFRRLPAGTYELWAFRDQADELQLIATNGGVRAPTRVGLSAGEATVTVQAPKR